MNILHNNSSFLSIKVGGKLLSLQQPLVMGVINLNEDSFFAASCFKAMDALVERVGDMLYEGAAIIDLGVASSRPGAMLIEAEEEIKTLKPILRNLCDIYPEAVFSIDTYHAQTARVAVGEGAAIINDISAGQFSKQMLSTVAQLKVPYIMMHMRGLPENMQHQSQYLDVTREVMDFFVKSVAVARDLGITDIIIDPGFGFAKELHHNYTLLKNLALFQMLECPILVGLSRKSMINKILHTQPEQALNGTTVLHTLALQNGAQILRVHDVKEAVQAIKLCQYYAQIPLQG